MRSDKEFINKVSLVLWSGIDLIFTQSGKLNLFKIDFCLISIQLNKIPDYFINQIKIFI